MRNCGALPHDGDVVRDAEHLVELVRDEDDRRAIVDETLERRKEFVDLVGHQHGGRLVEDQDVGAAVKNLDDHPLAFTDTELGYELVEIKLGADLFDLGDAAASGGEIDAATAPAGLLEDDVLEHGEVVGQLEVLMDHADTGADRVGW